MFIKYTKRHLFKQLCSNKCINKCKLSGYYGTYRSTKKNSEVVRPQLYSKLYGSARRTVLEPLVSTKADVVTAPSIIPVRVSNPNLYSYLRGSARKEQSRYNRLVESISESFPIRTEDGEYLPTFNRMLSVLPALKVDGSYSPTFRRVIAYFVRLIEARRALKMQQEAIEQERQDRLYLTHLRYSVIHGRARFALDDVERINQICIAQKSDQALDLLNFALLFGSRDLTLDIATAILTISDVMPVFDFFASIKPNYAFN